MATPSDVSKKIPRLPSSFFRLPLELREVIYCYSYGTDLAVSPIISKKQWKARELQIRDDKIQNYKFKTKVDGSSKIPESESVYQIKVFPINPLHAMIVSKQFFREAAITWFRTATLGFRNYKALDDFIQAMDQTPICGVTSIDMAWECNTTTHGVFTPNLRWCIGLRNLRVTVHGGLNVIEDKYDWTDELECEDFKDLQIVRHVSAIPSLINLEILPGPHWRVYTEQDANIYKRNLETMQAYILSLSTSRTGGFEFSGEVLEEAKESIKDCSVQEVKCLANV